jgi:3-hydroxymyristoyl/3-hydroxydecanoyl-(acyl carrier protein) dehydratase
MSALDSRTDSRNDVLTPTGSNGALSAHLKVDQRHPFFFDHPLDHVPGLLLLEGAVQLAQTRAAGSKYVSRIEASFLKYALFGSPILLTATDTVTEGRSRYDVLIGQAGTLRARIQVEISDYRSAAGTAGDRAPVVPCAREAVNKARPENVLIGVPTVTADAATVRVRPPPPDSRMSDSAHLIHPLYLLEAFMQLQRYLNRLQSDGARIRDILVGVGFRQLAPVADRTAPLTVRGPTGFAEAPQGRLVRSADIDCEGQILARCEIRTARPGAARRTA